MGCEDYRIALRRENLGTNECIEFFSSLDHVAPVEETPLCGERHFAYNDGSHIIEIEVAAGVDGGVAVSLRFALCHPLSIDDVFAAFVRRVSTELGMAVEVVEDSMEEGESRLFSAPEYGGLDECMRRTVKCKREYWIRDFGPETATLGCSDALRLYLGKLRDAGTA